MRTSAKILFACFILMGLTACQEKHEIVIEVTPGTQVTFDVTVAQTPQEQSQGLMFVESMSENQGMVFDYSEPQLLKFWMKNTLIPLDIIFFNSDGEVAYIEHSAKPHDLTPRGPDVPTCLVLEINGGLAKQMGIEVGTKIITKDPFECLQSPAE